MYRVPGRPLGTLERAMRLIGGARRAGPYEEPVSLADESHSILNRRHVDFGGLQLSWHGVRSGRRS